MGPDLIGNNPTGVGVHLLQFMMVNLTSPLIADHAYEVWELEFNSKVGYYMHCGALALGKRKHGDAADDFYFHRATNVNMARVAASMDGRCEHWDSA